MAIADLSQEWEGRETDDRTNDRQLLGSGKRLLVSRVTNHVYLAGKPMTNNGPTKTTHLSPKETAQIIARLQDLAAAGKIRTQDPTAVPYRGKRAIAHYDRHAGAGSNHQVPLFLLGATSAAYAQVGPVPAGTACVLQLEKRDGSMTNAIGEVAGCSQLKGAIHFVRVKLHKKLDLYLFVTQPKRSHALVVDDSPFARRIATVQLEALNVVVDYAEDGLVALGKIEANRYDFILMDMEMPKMDGFTAVPQLRQKGFKGCIIALTALTRDEDSQRCLDLGCDHYIKKPYTAEILRDVIQNVVGCAARSTLKANPSMKAFIAEFVAALPKRASSLEDALQASNTEQMTADARSLKAEGGMYGFNHITDCAAKIETDILQGSSLDSLHGEVTKLIQLCRFARAS